MAVVFFLLIWGMGASILLVIDGCQCSKPIQNETTDYTKSIAGKNISFTLGIKLHNLDKISFDHLV